MSGKKQSLFIFAVAFLVMLLAGRSLYAHCEIPCGIYNDEMRFKMIEEDITTVEKAMNQINELSQATPVNYNQLVRWITNKEKHAGKIQEVVYQYFLTQRIKPGDPADEAAYREYTKKLALLHNLLFYAMKTKQTTDVKNVEKLRALLSEFHDAYFSEEDSEHLKEHHN